MRPNDLLKTAYSDARLRHDVRFIVKRWATHVANTLDRRSDADDTVMWILRVLYEDCMATNGCSSIHADVMDIVGSRVIVQRDMCSSSVVCSINTMWSAMCRKASPENDDCRRMCNRYVCMQDRVLRREKLARQPTEVIVSAFTTLVMCGVRAVSFGRLGHEEIYARLLFMYSDTVSGFLEEASVRLKSMPLRCFSEGRSELDTEEVYALMSMQVVFCKVTSQLLRYLPWTFGHELMRRPLLDSLLAHASTHAGRVIAGDLRRILRTLHLALETGHCGRDDTNESLAILRTRAGRKSDIGTRACFPEMAATSLSWADLRASLGLGSRARQPNMSVVHTLYLLRTARIIVSRE